MKDRNPQNRSQNNGAQVSWIRRLKNHWVSHNQNTLHLFLGICSLGLSAVNREIGFLGLLLVLLLFFLHMNLHGLDRFLHRFRDTSNLPTGQMRQVTSFCMILFLAASVLCMAAFAFVMPFLGTLIRSWFSGRANSPPPETEMIYFSDTPMDSPDLTALAEQAGAPPSWLPVLETIMAVAAMMIAAAFLLGLLFQLIRGLYAFLFRSRNWDDDEKIFLKPVLLPLAPLNGSHDTRTKRRFSSFLRPASYREAVRKEYRKKIRRGLTACSANIWPGAAPSELEEAAGCRDLTLHQVYEKARYASDECTREDLDAIRTK